ncbi:sensor histidine kinase [Spirillospora sp. CA-294931]|uniref:sensor histidine kinase n=1 Tax=Spirillospora sp. CA-294931 TaxID=3240042 RepID=UPI003D9367C7
MVVGVGALVVLTVGGRYLADGASRVLVLDVVVGVVGCALLPVLTRRPVGVALLLAVLAMVSPAATPLATLGALLVAQRRDFRVAVGVSVIGAAAHVVQGLWRPNDGISLGWWLVLIAVGYGALIGWGAQTQARRALLVSLRERARRAEAEQGRRVAEARILERTRIAREMHDVLAHRLSLLATYAGALEYRPDAPPEKLAHAAGVVRAGVHQALDELREVICVLREDDEAVEGRPQPVLADLPRLVEESRDAGTRVRLDDRVVQPSALPPVAGRTAYRVVQEGLTNARKHAAGRPVRVLLEGRPGERLVIVISNPLSEGRALAPGAGTGLVGLTERVQLAGGRLDHEVSGGEFRLRAWLPWPA